MLYRPKASSTSSKYQIQSQIAITKPYKQIARVTSKTTTSNAKKANSFNNELLHQCRENHLNAGYNKRINNLKAITAQNRKIYERINSQKTMYSNRQLNKSYESSSSISKRLSQSKLSKRQNTPQGSRNDSRQKIRQKKVLQRKDNNTYNIESQNINNMKKNDIKKFSELFFKQQCSTTHTKNTRKEKNRRNSFAIPKQRQMELPKIRQKNTITLPYRSQKKDEYGMLHRIAEEMFDNPRTRKTLMI